MLAGIYSKTFRFAPSLPSGAWVPPVHKATGGHGFLNRYLTRYNANFFFEELAQYISFRAVPPSAS